MKAWPGSAWIQQHQIALYLIAILAGCLIGEVAPSSASAFSLAVNPLLGVLMFSTFLGIPLLGLLDGLRDIKFIGSLLLVNFVLVPCLVLLVTRIIHIETAVLIGVVLVLLAPCVDYVIVFSGIAGGDNHKLLAAAPLLLVLQMLLIPIYMYLIVGKTSLTVFTPGPFLHALVTLILLPLALACAMQLLASRFSWAGRVAPLADYLMAPIMMMTLLAVIASQFHSISSQLGELLTPIFVFALFALVAGILSVLTGKAFGLTTRSLRALTFSGVTRNSLVVLPIALALPAEFALTSSVVVTQTLVELMAMLLMIKIVPRMI